MDYQDRPKRCLSSYLGPSEHHEVLPVRYRQEDLSVQSSTVRSFNGPKSLSPRLPRPLDNQSRLSRTLYSTCTGDYSTTDFIGMDHKLEEVHSRTLTCSRLPRTSFQPRTSHCFSTQLLSTLTRDLSHLLSSTVMSAHKVTSIKSRISHYALFIHHGWLQLHFLQFWIKNRWSQHSQHWDSQIQLDLEYLSHLRWFNRPAVLRGVPLHVLEPSLAVLYGRFPDRMGSQLAEASNLWTMVSSGTASTYQLAGVGSCQISHSSVGTSMAQSNSQEYTATTVQQLHTFANKAEPTPYPCSTRLWNYFISSINLWYS